MTQQDPQALLTFRWHMSETKWHCVELVAPEEHTHDGDLYVTRCGQTLASPSPILDAPSDLDETLCMACIATLNTVPQIFRLHKAFSRAHPGHVSSVPELEEPPRSPST